MINLKKLHHNAYRCIDSEETRKFYDGFLGLPFIKAFEILNDKFEYKRWHDFDLHIALEVEESILLDYFKKGKNNNIETRGISNHGFIKSIYFRDPNGYVIELTTPTKNYKNIFKAKPREILNEWTSYKNENFK